ncbi:hypothetical protein DXT99_23065 [Pontibacter diazotrophicus]|uniref:Aspartyl protease n=1 Tax=Pontibacter diazotrophicus TaxID=1400979 RepID=A0A3D8L3Z3_9BACT|nr:hypothetical protein [Pontibacter diazotrophicus]RDV12013.1 hypothetical protein DXT99_23065 [Pontibacter diazotrophicus]
MKTLKRVLVSLIAIILISVIGGYFYFKSQFQPPANQLVLGDSITPTPFVWLGDSTENGVDEYSAMVLPVTLEGIPGTYYMQFDLGAPYSLFYGKVLTSLNEKYNKIVIHQNGDASSLEQFSFKVGNTDIFAKTIKVKDYGSAIDWNDSSRARIVGTIGADFIEDKVLTIDYKHENISVASEIPHELANAAQFSDFRFESRRVLLPSKIDGQEQTLLFDTGASAFELLTDKSTWNELSKAGSKEETYEANSWGKKLIVHNIQSNSLIAFGSVELPLSMVTYIEGTGFMQNMLMKFSGMGGMIGNKLFIGNILVLDTKNQKYALIE